MTHITEELNDALKLLQEGLLADLTTRCQPLQHLISQAKLLGANQGELKDARECQECKQKARQIRLLEDNIADLRRGLEYLRPQRQATEDFDSVERKLLDSLKRRAPESVICAYPGGDELISYNQYADLARLYGDLYSEQRTLISSFSTLKKKLKSSKEKVAAWNHCFERDSFDVNVGGKKVVFRRSDVPPRASRLKAPQSPLSDRQSSDDNLNTPQALPNAGAGITDSENRWPKPPNFPDVAPTEADLANGEAAEDGLPETHNSDPGSTQSQAFGDDTATQALPSEPSSDIPTVVAARPVRRNRRSVLEDSASARHPPIENTANAVTVKKEPSLNSSVEILDPSVPSNGFRLPELEDTTRRVEGVDNFHWIPPVFNSVVSTQDDSGERDPNSSTSFQQPNQGDPPQATGTKRAALQPMDANARLNQNAATGVKRRKTGTRGEEAIQTVAEDGEVEYEGNQRGLRRQTDTRSPKNTTPRRRPAHNRLEDLLGSAPGPKPVLASLSPRTPGARTPHNRSDIATPVQNVPTPTEQGYSSGDLPMVDKLNRPPICNAPQAGPTTSNLRNEPPPDDDEILPEDEPFRARPIHRLSLDHFRLNPARNQGLSHAFDEVVRRKSERKCLPGCVLPNCCGPKFRALAELQRFDTTTNHKDVTVDSMNSEDRQVLEEYLGGNRNVLETMSEDEFRELLLEAWTRRLANQHGRHRHVHDRARSPPGFWETDMPSTQEQERYREEAQKRDREKVAERHREAMKPDGLWMFADE